MKKKIILAFGIIIFIVLAAGMITNYADSGRVTTGHEPKYCIKTISADGSKVTYWGLGYKVIRYVGVSPEEPYENNIGAKMGSWFMKYELPIDQESKKDNKEDNKESVTIEDLDDFYNTTVTKEKDIRDLSGSYSSFDAQKDNCFVIGAMVHNGHLYEEFMTDCKNKKTAFIRVAQNTIEGDLILLDILYFEKTDRFYLVHDNTRDKFAAETERKITLKEFKNITEYTSGNHMYWALYNDEITEENFETENVYVITTIN